MTIHINPEMLAHPEFLAVYREGLLEGVKSGLISEAEVEQVIAILGANDPAINTALAKKLAEMIEQNMQTDTGN